MKHGWQREPTDGWLVGWLAGWLVGWLEDLIGSGRDEGPLVWRGKCDNLQAVPATSRQDNCLSRIKCHLEPLAFRPQLIYSHAVLPMFPPECPGHWSCLFGVVAVVTSPTTNGCSVVWCGVA